MEFQDLDFEEAKKILNRMVLSAPDGVILSRWKAEMEDRLDHTVREDDFRAGIQVAIEILSRVTTWRNGGKNG